MDLVRDLLDKRIVDRNGRDLGRVDSIVLEHDAGKPARIAALEIGPAVLANRIHPALGRWIRGLEVALGLEEGRPVRIPIDAVLSIHDHVKVDAAFSETAASAVEQWLRRWIAAIPRLR